MVRVSGSGAMENCVTQIMNYALWAYYLETCAHTLAGDAQLTNTCGLNHGRELYIGAWRRSASSIARPQHGRCIAQRSSECAAKSIEALEVVVKSTVNGVPNETQS